MFHKTKNVNKTKRNVNNSGSRDVKKENQKRNMSNENSGELKNDDKISGTENGNDNTTDQKERLQDEEAIESLHKNDEAVIEVNGETDSIIPDEEIEGVVPEVGDENRKIEKTHQINTDASGELAPANERENEAGILATADVNGTDAELKDKFAVDDNENEQSVEGGMAEYGNKTQIITDAKADTIDPVDAKQVIPDDAEQVNNDEHVNNPHKPTDNENDKIPVQDKKLSKSESLNVKEFNADKLMAAENDESSNKTDAASKVTPKTSDESHLSISPDGETKGEDDQDNKKQAFGFDFMNLEDDLEEKAEFERKKRIEEAELKRKKERQDLMDSHKYLLEKRRSVGNTNIQLQTKLAEYFRRKKADAAEQALAESGGSSSMLDTSVDFAERYSKYIATMVDIRNDFERQRTMYNNQITNLKEASIRRQHEAIDAHSDIHSFVMKHAKTALSNRTARPMNIAEYLPLLSLMKRKQLQVSDIRLDSLKIQNEVDKIESVFKSREDLTEGLRLIDFEQLKIENQTYNDKIEERNEEIGKLRRKITSTVQIMTHVKEKLQCVTYENGNLKQELIHTDNDLNQIRDKLAKIKQARDSLRLVYAKMQRNCGLLGKPELLRNYESCMDAIENKSREIEKLKQKTRGFLKRAQDYQNKLENVERDIFR